MAGYDKAPKPTSIRATMNLFSYLRLLFRRPKDNRSFAQRAWDEVLKTHQSGKIVRCPKRDTHAVRKHLMKRNWKWIASEKFDDDHVSMYFVR